jgi:hypothetical protein
MRVTHCRVRACLAFSLLFPPAAASAQTTGSVSRLEVAAGPGFLTSGRYFTGPGDLELASGNALAGTLQASLAVHPSFAVVLTGAFARPDWQVTGIPVIGSVGVSGASLWFVDAAARGRVRLGPTPGTPAVFAQVGAGVARYSLEASLLGETVDERASNVAVALGVGLAVPVTPRFGLELMAKDYIASFTSVRDLAELGIEGQRAHTVIVSLLARVSP